MKYIITFFDSLLYKQSKPAVFHFLYSHLFNFITHSCWSYFASSRGSVQWRMSEFQVFFKWNFISGSIAIWKLNPSFRMSVAISSTQLNCGGITRGIDFEIFVFNMLVSSISLEMVVSVLNRVSTTTSWVKFSLFLLCYLMLLIWDMNMSLNNRIVNFEIGSSISVWCSWWWSNVNTFKNFASGNDSI